LAFSQRTINDRLHTFERAQKLEALGRKMFFDPALSVSGKISCATCHDPAFAYGPPNALPVQQGGSSGREWGIRAVPSLKSASGSPIYRARIRRGNEWRRQHRQRPNRWPYLGREGRPRPSASMHSTPFIS